MDAELFRALFLKDLIGLEELRLGHTVFGITRIVHDAVAEFEETARIIAAANRLRYPGSLLKEVDHRKIIQIDYGSELGGISHVLRRSII